MKKLTSIILLFFAVFSIAIAEKPKSKQFGEAFNQMKSLAGQWQGKMSEGDKSKPFNVNYKVSSAGSAIIETTFPGEPMEMVSVYTEVNGKIQMTHYCAMQNQPTLQLQSYSKNKFEFNFISGTNLNVKKDVHMHNLTLLIKDKNKMEQHWTQFKDGKSAGIHVSKLSRVN